MIENLMTPEQYLAGIEKAKKLFVSLQIAGATDAESATPPAAWLNRKIAEVNGNFEHITDLAVSSEKNRAVARKVVNMKELALTCANSRAMLASAARTELKSADLRNAYCTSVTDAELAALSAAKQDKEDAESYHAAIMHVKGDLEHTIELLRDQMRLVQNLLYLGGGRARKQKIPSGRTQR